MKKKHLIPLVLFCLIFLAYSLYFVKVVNETTPLVRNSIGRSLNRAFKQGDTTKEEKTKSSPDNISKSSTTLREPITRYVNYSWLNVRKRPHLSSPVIEKIYRNDAIDIIGYPNASWAYIKTAKGEKGYVARRYLSNKKLADKTAVNNVTTPTPSKTELTENVSSNINVVAETESPEIVKINPDKDLSSKVIYDIPVITYNHISNESGGRYTRSLTLPEINFFAQLDYLVEKGFKTYTFYDLKNIVAGNMNPEHAVILTFDGGFDNAYIAAQHLNGKGMKGVFFITTDNIGTPGFLDWRQIKKMRSWGMEIGSSGVKGVNLARSSEFYARDEIERSKKIIEEKLGESIISFAYPSGAYNSNVKAITEKAGYLFARGADSGSRYTNKQLFGIPTLRVFFPAGRRQFDVWLSR